MKNKIEDLRNHLFAQLERLSDDELTTEELENEIKRSKAMCDVAQVVVNSAKVEVDFVRAVEGRGTGFIPIDNNNKPLNP